MSRRAQFTAALLLFGATATAGSNGVGTGGFCGLASGASSVSGLAPISVSGSVVSCVPASGAVGGCLTADTQSISGYKDFISGGQFDGIMQCTTAFPRNLGTHSVNVSQINYTGLMVGSGPITQTFDGDGVTIESRRLPLDIGAGLLVRSSYFRDAGAYMSVNSGLPCDSALFDVGSTGNVTVTAAPEATCVQSVDVLNRGVITDGTAASGHVLMQSYDKLYLHVRGRLANNHDGMQTDGGHPVCDGGTSTQLESDGGCYYSYAGSHGNFVTSTPSPLLGSWLYEARNTNGLGGDTKYIIDSYGGFTNSHGLVRNAFPACPGVSFQTSLGQYSEGVSPGTLLYADDTESWYQCGSTGWAKVLSAVGQTFGSWTGNTVGVVGTGTSFLGGFKPTSAVKFGSVTCSWAVAGLTGSVGVVMRIRNITDATTLCTCTLGACTTAASTPLSCSCSATAVAGKQYTIQYDPTALTGTDCGTDPSGTLCTVEMLQ